MPRLNGPEYPAAMGVMRQALHDVLKHVLAEAQVPVRLGMTVSSFDEREDGADA